MCVGCVCVCACDVCVCGMRMRGGQGVNLLFGVIDSNWETGCLPVVVVL